MIDLAMPRDIEPALCKLDGVCLYDLDSLQSMAGQALAVRKQESVKCHQLIEHHVQDFQLCIERTQTSNFSLGELQGGAKASLTYPRGPTAARFWPPREWRPTPLARDLA
jgi:hypothetical protein